MADTVPIASQVPGLPGAAWATARIDEELDLSFLHEQEHQLFLTLKTPHRQREWLAGRKAARAALRAVGAGATSVIRNQEGAPKLVGPHAERVDVAITHGASHAAAIATQKLADWPYVGIDWVDERDTDRIRRLSRRVLTLNERILCQDKDIPLRLAWGSKEVIAKATRTGMFMYALTHVQLESFDVSNGAATINIPGTLIRFMMAPNRGLVVVGGVSNATRIQANQIARG